MQCIPTKPWKQQRKEVNTISSSNSGYHASIEDMPEQIKEAVDRQEQLTGRRHPVNESETYSGEVSEASDHPYDAIMEDADLSVAAALEPEGGERRVVADGGIDPEKMEVYSDGLTAQEAAREARDSEYDVTVHEFGEEGVAVAGDISDVRNFVNENDFEGLQRHYREDWHSEVPRPEEGKMEEARPQVMADGGTPVDTDRYEEGSSTVEILDEAVGDVMGM